MKEGISKQEFIKSLEQTLRLTRAGVESLELVDNDTVIIYFEDGHIPVNIACNSGIAIIRDVANKVIS